MMFTVSVGCGGDGTVAGLSPKHTVVSKEIECKPFLLDFHSLQGLSFLHNFNLYVFSGTQQTVRRYPGSVFVAIT